MGNVIIVSLAIVFPNPFRTNFDKQFYAITRYSQISDQGGAGLATRDSCVRSFILLTPPALYESKPMLGLRPLYHRAQKEGAAGKLAYPTLPLCLGDLSPDLVVKVLSNEALAQESLTLVCGSCALVLGAPCVRCAQYPVLREANCLY